MTTQSVENVEAARAQQSGKTDAKTTPDHSGEQAKQSESGEQRSKKPTEQPKLEPAEFSIIVMISHDSCWLEPDGKWKGPTDIAPTLADVKLSFNGQKPLNEMFHLDFKNAMKNIRRFKEQIAIPGSPTTGIQNKSIVTGEEVIRFRHALFEKKEKESTEPGERYTTHRL
jgi:hypothetical protein